MLRPYQQDAIDRVESAFLSGKRSVLYSLPTGGGKTVIFMEIVRRAVQRGDRCVILTHRIELASQTAVRFRDGGLDVDIFNSSSKAFPQGQAVVAMWQTVNARLKLGYDFGEFDLAVFDEAHRAPAEQASKTVKCFKPKRLLGVTATPQRPDGKGLKCLFDELIVGPSIKDLISQGYLSPYRCFAPAELVDRAALKVTAGEFVQSQAAATAVKNMAKLVDNALKYFPDKKTAIVFCADVDHAERAASSFRRIGVPAVAVHGQSDKAERAWALSLLADKKIKFLTSCDVLTEGIDVPNVNGVVMARPTKSIVVYLQQVGRCLRPSPDKQEAIILDLVGNVYEHGLPCENREWSLEPKEKNKNAQKSKDANVKRCYACFAVVPKHSEECDECGAVFESKRTPPQEVDMRLKEIAPSEIKNDEEKAKRALSLPYKQAVAFLDTYASLVFYAQLKGYKKGWAWYQAKDKGLIGQKET